MIRQLRQIQRRIRVRLLGQSIRGIIQGVQQQRLTYLTSSRLEFLALQCARQERRGISGRFIEAGCALGGSAIVITAAKAKARPLDVYDVFGIIPPPSESDGPDVRARYQVIREGKSDGIGGDPYYGYLDDLERRIAASFTTLGFPPQDHAVSFIKGLFQDTMHPKAPVALAHIDGDWYDSVSTCLQRIVPNLAPGGLLLIDDYCDWSGCRRAVDDYFNGSRAGYHFEFSDGERGSLLIRKKC